MRQNGQAELILAGFIRDDVEGHLLETLRSPLPCTIAIPAGQHQGVPVSVEVNAAVGAGCRVESYLKVGLLRRRGAGLPLADGLEDPALQGVDDLPVAPGKRVVQKACLLADPGPVQGGFRPGGYAELLQVCLAAGNGFPDRERWREERACHSRREETEPCQLRLDSQGPRERFCGEGDVTQVDGARMDRAGRAGEGHALQAPVRHIQGVFP